jgi:hypothetical protein
MMGGMDSVQSVVAGVTERFFTLQCDAGSHNYRDDRVRYDDIKVTKKHYMRCGEVSFESPTVRG